MSSVPSLPDFSLCGFEVIRGLGDGPDKVYQVRHIDTGVLYVLKVFDGGLHGINNPFEVSIPTKFIHPNIMPFESIVDMISCNSKSKGIGIVMQLAKSNFRALVMSQYTLNEKIDYMYQALQGIKFMHDNGYLHLDIKIDNILVQDGVSRVADFGFSRKMANGVSKGILLPGLYITPAYRPPEIYMNESPYNKYNDKCDIWTIGHLFGEFFCGVHLFKIQGGINSKKGVKEYLSTFTDRVRDDISRSATSRLPQPYNKYVYDIIYGCLSYDPTLRPTLESIMLSPIFNQCRDKYSTTTGRIMSAPRLQPLDDTHHYILSMLKYMKTMYPKVSSRLFFLAADLYYRSCGSADIRGQPKENLDMLKHILVGVCMWISMKSCFGYIKGEYDTIYREYILKNVPSATTEYVDAFETRVFIYLSGDINPDYLYEVCEGTNHLLYIFRECVLKQDIYNLVDIQSLKSILSRISPGESKMSLSISHLS